MTRFLLPLYLGFLVASCLKFLFGSGGLGEYRELMTYRDLLDENIGDLKEINKGLNQKLDMLSSNPDTVKIQARELGFFEEKERIIKIEGYSPKSSFYEVGKLVKRRKAAEKKTVIFKLVGIAIPPVFFFKLTIARMA